MNALHAAIEIDASHAPEILIFRMTRWPSLAEQKALLQSLVENKQLRAHSSALLDITELSELPNPDTLADALAQSVTNRAVLKRVACVVASQSQAHFVTTLQKMAPLPSKIGMFFAQGDALKWLQGVVDS